MGNEEATSLFKEYVDALCSNDLESVKDYLEPTFYTAASIKLRAAHTKLVPPYKIDCQNLRKGHETQFYLYKVENYLLSGAVSLDRSQNKPDSHFMVHQGTDLIVNGQQFKGTHISNVDIN